MYLKSIEICGFKSFADKTVLSFLPPSGDRNSITAIVGPNGSGKSNVSDAIRWVMGEQKMTQLRGKKSEDVIFAGSAGKGAMSMASVMMTLDNRESRAGITAEEIVLGRRLYRSGESEYIINGNAVRLLDLQLLLARAQFGQGSYAIIGQGMIDRMLLQSPQERKTFFDEASGIKEFQIKRHQASLRLLRTEEHIAQAELLLQEISPRLKILSRQVKKLEERQEVELKLRELQEGYYATLSFHYTSQTEEFTKELQSLATALKDSEGQLLSVQEELATLAHAKTRQDVFASLQAEYEDVVRKKNTLERERAILQGKLQTEYSRTGQHQTSWLEAKVGELKSSQENFKRSILELEENKKHIQRDLDESRQKVSESEITKASLKSEMARLDASQKRVSQEQTLSQFTGMKAVQAVLEAAPRLGQIHGAVAQLGKAEQKFQVALDVAAGAHLSSLVVADEEVAKRSIAYLREGQFGTATFLPITKIRPREIPPYVYDFLQEKGVHGLALEIIRFKEEFASIFAFVFGSTLVVEDFAVAKSIGIGRVRMVTLEGDLFETTGAIKGGYRRTHLQGLSFGDTSASYTRALESQSYEEKIRATEAEYEQVERAYNTLGALVRQKENEKSVLEQKIELLLQEKGRIDHELATLEQELSLQTMSPEQFGHAMKDLAVQKEEIDAALVLSESEQAIASEKIARFNDEEEQKKIRVFALQDTMQQIQITVNDLVSKKNEVQVELAKIETKREDLDHEIAQELQVTSASLLVRGIPRVDSAKMEEAVSEIQKLKYKLSLIGGIESEVVQEYEETKARHDGLSLELDDLKKAVRDLHILIEELDKVMKKKRNKAFKQIKLEFRRYFAILFEGGEADLLEVYGEEETGKLSGEESEELLTTEAAEKENTVESETTEGDGANKKIKKILQGIDVVACPPGKKIKNIQALSGGERTLTSIALMCAILKTNPSPFVVLDEVEAALDEANTLRVVNIVKELSSETQFVIITHNRVTMHATDALYGVTMGADGMSRLLSVKLENRATE